MYVEKEYLLLGAARKVIPPISEDRRRKSKLNTTSGAGYMEVKVKIIGGAHLRHVGIAIHA